MIHNATAEDGAVYFCKVYNSAGEISSEPIEVKVTGNNFYQNFW